MWLRRLCAGALLVGVFACGDRNAGELREWRPEDHQPPPAVAPEGQGEGSEGSADVQKRAVVALWAMRCASCHGAEGRGDGPGRPPGAAIPDLTQPALQAERTDAQLAETILRGRGMMPAFGDEITDAGVNALVQHIRGLKATR